MANRAVGFDGRMGEAESLREVMDRFAVQLLPLLHHDRQAATPAVDIVFAVLDQGVDTQAAFGDAALALGVTEGEGGELNGFLRYDPGRLDPGAAAEAMTNFLHLHEASCEVGGDWSVPLRVLQAQALARATGVATAQSMVAAGGRGIYLITDQVIPTPSHLLDRISPIFPPFFLVFCACSPSRRGGSNEPKTGIQGQETVSRAPKHRFGGPANSGRWERMGGLDPTARGPHERAAQDPPRAGRARRGLQHVCD